MPNLKNKNVLDIGCGNGTDIKLFEKIGAKSIYGIDCSKYMVSEAKKTVKEPKNIFVSDIEKTNFKNNLFDIIVGRFSFHYLQKFDNAYNELSRILKHNGALILIVQHPLRDLYYQKKQIYGNQEIVKVEIYKNKVPLYFSTHTFANYFSKEFFKNFYLDYYEEEQKPKEYLDNYNSPGFMGIKAIKR